MPTFPPAVADPPPSRSFFRRKKRVGKTFCIDQLSLLFLFSFAAAHPGASSCTGFANSISSNFLYDSSTRTPKSRYTFFLVIWSNIPHLNGAMLPLFRKAAAAAPYPSNQPTLSFPLFFILPLRCCHFHASPPPLSFLASIRKMGRRGEKKEEERMDISLVSEREAETCRTKGVQQYPRDGEGESKERRRGQLLQRKMSLLYFFPSFLYASFSPSFSASFS